MSMYTTDQFGNAIPSRELLAYAMRWNFKEWLGVAILAFTALSVWGARLMPPVKEPSQSYAPQVIVTQYVRVPETQWRTQFVESPFYGPTNLFRGMYLTNLLDSQMITNWISGSNLWITTNGIGTLYVDTMNVTNYLKSATNMGLSLAHGTNIFL